MEPTREKRVALLITVGVVVWTMLGLWPELSNTRVDRNDNVSHFTLIQGMVNAVEQGRNPLDFWSPETGFGYPEIRVYQPLAHAIVVVVYFLLGKTVSLMTVFCWIRYLSLVLLPITFYGAARLLQLPPLGAAFAAAMSPLVSAPALYGLEWSSYIWRGYGLFPQAVAMHFFLLSVGVGFHAIRRGKYLVLTGVLLGLTALSELVYGYMGAVTLCLMAVLPDAKASRGIRALRTVVIGLISALLSLFQLLPPILDSAIVNRSSWEPAWKWDSWGARQVLIWLFKGQLLDFGRLPVFSLLAAGSIAAVLWDWRRGKGMTFERRFLISGAILWTLLFFGRPFWGPLVLAVGVVPDMPLHRVVAAVQAFLLFLAAYGLARLCCEVARAWSPLAAGIVGLVAIAPAVLNQAQYISESNAGGEKNLAAYSSAEGQLDGVLTALRQRGGRTYPGLASSWGYYSMVGAVPAYLLLTENGIPTVSYLAHSLALPGDLIPDFNELRSAHYRLFNVESLLAPAQFRQSIPKMLSPRLAAGPFVVFDAPGGGYFDVVDAPVLARADKKTFYKINKAWLGSDWPDYKARLLLSFFGDGSLGLPRVEPGRSLPGIRFPGTDPGQVTSQQQSGDAYQAEVDVQRASYVLFKMTWHPNWNAWVDGKPVKTVMLSPGFTGVPVTPGRHRVLCRYEPGNWKLSVACSGLFCVLMLGVGERFGYLPGARSEALSTSPASVLPVVPERGPGKAVNAGPRKRRTSRK